MLTIQRNLMLLLLLLPLQVNSATLDWGDLRDGRLLLRPSQPDQLQIRWTPAWLSDANHEQLYLLDGKGQLVRQIDITAEQERGEQQLALTTDAGDYQLSIPGYSFRNYRIRHANTTAALLAPTKIHFSMEVSGNPEFYFSVAAHEHAILAGKHHGGVRQLQAVRIRDGHRITLPLHEHARYWEFDQISFPVSNLDETWRLTLIGSGKAAFWLDGTNNLFARQIDHLFVPQAQPGQVSLYLGNDVRGPTPALGMALPYALPPDSTHALVDALGVQSANYYSFVDALARNPRREIDFRQLYNTRFGILHDITLLAGSGRQAVLKADTLTRNGLNNWLSDTRELPRAGRHYLAFADEPNLNYPDYKSFELYFEQVLQHLKNNPQLRSGGVRIALPPMSRWLDGPFRVDAADRRGIDWAARLLSRYESDIDAVAWHEWMVRDLLATRRYRDSVRQAAELVGLDRQGRPNKALLLGQTNISSGYSLSPYQQETHYASLWWAAVAINSAQDGWLEMLNWFQAADEPDYPKGFLRSRNGQFSPKPVALAQQFIRQHWLGQVIELDNSAFEVDTLAMQSTQRYSLLGVNKAQRMQQVTLHHANDACQAGAQLHLFTEDSQVRTASINCTNELLRFDLPEQALFALTWERMP